MTTENEEFELEREKLADAIGEFVKYWGFKSIHGRVWLYLFTAEEPMTASQLVKKLGVTKSLVSMVLAELLEYKVIEKVDIGSIKSPGYVSVLDLEQAIFGVLRKRERPLLSKILKQIESFRSQPELSKTLETRIKHLEKMTSYAIDAMNRLLNAKAITTSKLKLLLKLSR